MQLKNYQSRALEALQQFFDLCKQGNPVQDAYATVLQQQGLPKLAYRDYGFDRVPYVCIRIPTGGGKTVLGSYAVSIAARSFLDNDFPVTLWLVPSNTIRLQTVEALKKPSHPYRIQLDNAFNRQVLVLDIDEVNQIRAHDLGNKAIVVVSTLANLRVTDTSGRKVYAYHEDFEPHFAKLPGNHPSLPLLERVSESDIQENGLSVREIGKIKYSFANLLAVYRPLVIVDEAHNARTSLTFETLKRIHPQAVIEFTATPNVSPTNGSNVLFHVSAAELKEAEMIKLPIMLTEHQNWQDAIRDAVITRNKLALDAQKDEDYIRPIALFQAEARNGEVTVEALEQHLINELKIDKEKIAIATGTQRELDGINLFDPACKIEYVITIEALKEGWDCSFAYVFCSVKQVSSSKDAEQLLGRVLRMPYARKRVIEDLNRAYAHLSASRFSRAAQELTDKLIAMGFNELEVASFLRQRDTDNDQGDLFGGTEQTGKVDHKPALTFDLSVMPDLSALSPAEKSQLAVSRDGDATVVRVTGEVSPTLAKTLVDACKKKEDKEAIQRHILVHNTAIEAAKAPSERGEVFGSLPLLCIQQQAELELVEPEIFLGSGNWNLLEYSAELKSFRILEDTNTFAIDIDGKDMSYHLADTKEVIGFNEGFIEVTEQDLVRWLDRELRSRDLMQNQLVRFLVLLVSDLLKRPNVTLTGLVRNKFPLSRAIRDLIALYRQRAQKKGYQASLFGDDAHPCLSDQFRYEFLPDAYPSRPPHYTGSFKFKKHYFPQQQIEDLKSSGEEYECAKAIEGIAQVKYWIRNLVRREQASFWLPLAHSKFYPDFVSALQDGRMLVVEYKGEAYVTNDDSKEKRLVGELWETSSKGQCLFLMAVEQDNSGRDVREQILAKIERG